MLCVSILKTTKTAPNQHPCCFLFSCVHLFGKKQDCFARRPVETGGALAASQPGINTCQSNYHISGLDSFTAVVLRLTLGNFGCLYQHHGF